MGNQNQTKTMSTFVLKLHSKSNDELRRVSVTTDISLDALLTRLRELFALSGKSRIALKYVDEDGDTITIGSTAELHECMALAQSLGKVSTKISVETDEKPAVETNARRTSAQAATRRRRRLIWALCLPACLVGSNRPIMRRRKHRHRHCRCCSPCWAACRISLPATRTTRLLRRSWRN